MRLSPDGTVRNSGAVIIGYVFAGRPTHAENRHDRSYAGQIPAFGKGHLRAGMEGEKGQSDYI